MQAGTRRFASLPAIRLGGSGNSKSGPPADAIEIVVLIVNNSIESKKGEQAAIKSDAIVKPAHRYDDMRDSVYLHPPGLHRIFTLKAHWRKSRLGWCGVSGPGAQITTQAGGHQFL